MTKDSIRKLLSAIAVCLIAASAHADTSDFSVHPSNFAFDHKNDYQRFVVVKTTADGVTRDVTHEAGITFEPEGVLTWDVENKMFRPQADGTTTIVVKHGESEQRIETTVANAGNVPPVSFLNEVQPVLMRAGCNSGACHGSAQGKNGFGLSLFGYDPPDDYLNLTREVRARRINVALPEESLMLQKPTGEVPHEGGKLFEKDSAMYNTIKRWIAEGANDDTTEAPKLTGIRLVPDLIVLEGEGSQHQFVVQAQYEDGTDKDVTDTAILASSDDLTLKVDEKGVATAGGRGETYVMARYGNFAVVSQAIVVPADANLEWPDVEPSNYIDEYVFKKLKKLRVAPAEKASDEVFVRRAYIDILGVLPTADETQAFLADESPDKRAKLIDNLVQRPQFTQLWTMKWAEALQVRSSNQLDEKGMYRYNDWLRESFAENKPVDELVRELLSAEGGNFTAPAANFYLLENEPNLIAENVAQTFFGIRLQCAQCHNHPFERWTMDDYYSFAAFFAQVGKKNSEDPRESIVFNRGRGEVRNLRDNSVMKPKFLGGETPDIGNRDRREVLAEWMTSDKNPWFAENIANRIWAHFMGRGIIDPPDDVRVTNPPSNPELLEVIGAKLKEADYDLRSLVRDICNSYVYQMATTPRNPASKDERNFAVRGIRRLPAEQLLDAISQVTETNVKFTALPLGARAVEAVDGRTGNYFLDVFGRPARESVCTCERSNDPTLAQALHLINGDTVDRALKQGSNRLDRLLKAEASNQEIVTDLYLAALSRKPTEQEMTDIVGYIEAQENRRHALEDLYWSVLNSKEFVFNH